MKINSFKQYPRFIFNCSDEYGFSTMDIEDFKHFKNDDDLYPISSLKIGDILSLKRADLETPVKYKISNIEIRDIRYDTEENLYGIYEDDRRYLDEGKFILMAIFVSMDLVNEN